MKHLVLYGRNIVESLMVKEAKAFMAAVANGMRVTYIDPRATITACKATRYWQVRPNSDYALNLAIIHEVLKQEAYDKDFVAGFVSGMDDLREAVKDTTPEWQERHTGVPADELRAFVTEIAAEAPQVIFHPGWMSARHKQSFYVSRSALILNALMGNIEIPGGYVLGKPPELYGRKGLNHLTDRVPAGRRAARGRRRHRQAAMGSGHRHGAPGVRRHGDGQALRHRRLLRLPPRSLHRPARSRGDATCAGQAEAARLDRRALFGDWAGMPTSSCPSRPTSSAPISSARRTGPVPVFAMRDQAIEPRFDSRPAWWIFREILHRMDIKEALDFETIEELWNYQLDGTGVTVAEMREAGIVALAAAPKLIPRDELKFPTPSGKIEIESEILKQAGLPSLPAYVAQAGADG